MKTCEDCGCRLDRGRCPNCDEELLIIDQYNELAMPLPPEDSEFMQKAKESEIKINKRHEENTPR